ncbi:MAG TPA: response regulator transcription factor [Anaerolineae bacterium]|nr:response regulator transcription factor [Anaerolineae bacterium]HOR00809.1 response regulator transcription factor [Anaerolineae bacterium]HPL27554.1 response regulator transcription factor [Anaerolineae bacterium]
MSVRILVADDHGLVRAGLRALLNDEPNLEVVGEAADGAEALAQAAELAPDVVLMDVSMPGLGGIEATRRLMERAPGTRILIMTVHEDEGLLQESIRAGAAGYIVKRALESELIDAIRAVCQGHIYVHPAMTRALLGGAPSASADDESHEPLTPREREVLVRIAQGYTSRQIADEWTISVRTVESHRANLMAKLGLRSRADVVRYAREHGYL